MYRLRNRNPYLIEAWNSAEETAYPMIWICDFSGSKSEWVVSIATAQPQNDA
jgi:hypothetical protein